MKKKFNITGLCIPEKHYMVDTSARIDAILEMVTEGDYFLINRPRQYGKTTTLSLLEERLQAHSDYFPMGISFEGISSESYQDEPRFLSALFIQFQKVFRLLPNHPLRSLIEKGKQLVSLPELDQWITEFVLASPTRIVLMIDEVDKSSNHQLFLDVLALLRTKYLEAARGKDATFHSVILTGVHDIKSLKLKLRPDDERKYNSPWNIAVNFTVDLAFHPADIETMLTDYCATTGMEMDRTYIAEQLYHYTSGYPFLVSALCKIIDEGIQPEDCWLPEHIDKAVNQLLKTSNTNFEHVIKHLEDHQELYAVVEKIVLRGEQVSYNQYSPMMVIGVMYGILIPNDNVVAIHNRLYQEQIYDYMTTNLEVRELTDTSLTAYTLQPSLLRNDGTLDLDQVLLKFQEFMKQEYSRRDVKFLERNGRLVFFAFLRPILNGRGFAFKEPQISEEKRLDVVITFGAQKHVIELKIWHGDAAHQTGLGQLTEYLERTGHHEGALVIFDFTRKGQKIWKQEHIQVDGKEIFAVWV